MSFLPLSGLFRSRSQRRKPRPQAKKPRRLTLETLEDRVTPTILWTPQFGAEVAHDGGGEKLGTSGAVPVYLVFWGSYWNTTAGSLLASNTQFVVNEILSQSFLLDGLHEYGSNYRAYIPTTHGAAFDYTDPSSTSVSDSQVQNEVQYAIDQLGLPEPDSTSSKPIYLVITAPGVNTTIADAGGYHSVYTNYDLFEGDVWPVSGDETVYGWIGNNGSLQHLTNVISHEVIEAMTDPQTGNGITITQGSTWTGGGSNEVCDAEAEYYGTFLFNSWVQSFWSQANGAYEVSDGNVQNFWVTTSGSSATLNLYGDQFGAGSNDTFNIFTDSSGGVLAEMNNEIVDFTKGITGIVIYPKGGYNTINIYNTNVPVYVASTSYDTVNVGLGNTININALVDIYNYGGNGAYDIVNVDNSINSTGQNVSVYSSEIDGLAPAPIYYYESFIDLYGGSGPNNWVVSGTSSNYATYIQSGTGSSWINTVSVESTSGDLTVDGGSSTQAVYIGSNGSLGGGTLSGINGLIDIGYYTDTGLTYLTFDDSGDATGQTFNLNYGQGGPGGGQLVTTAMPLSYAVSWYVAGSARGGVTNVTVDGGTGLNTFNVFSTGDNSYSYATNINTGTAGAAVNVQSTFGNVNIDNQGGQDNVTIGSQAPTYGGTVANINGSVDVYGAGSTSLYVDDSGDTTPQTASMYDGRISGLAPANILWTPTSSATGGVTDLHVRGGSGGNTFNVYGTSNFYNATFLLTGTGNDTVNVLATTGTLNIDGSNGADTVTLGSLAPSLGGTLANIAGSVNVSNSSGSTTLVLDDSGDTLSKTATLTNSTVTGLAPAVIYYETGVSFLDILGGSGGNTFNVASTSNLKYGTRIQTGTGNDKVNVQATGGVLGIYNNAGNDTVTIGSLAPALGGTLANINAYVDVNGSGPVAVTVDDSGDATGQTATLTRNPAGTSTLSGMAPGSIPIYYENNVTSLTIDAGSGPDSLTVAGPSTSTHVTYNGGGGNNSLIGPNINNAWNITSTNAGTLDGNITFSSVQNLTGGTANDSFKFSNGKGITGNIDGSAGTNTLDYSLYAVGVKVNLPAGTATGVGGTVANIQNVTGSPKNDTIVGIPGSVIAGNGGLDALSGGPNDTFIMATTQLAGTTVTGTGSGNTLVGANLTNTWVVNGAGSGKLNGGITFSGITNLTGGSGSDKFQLLPAGSVAGTIDGGGGANTLDYSAYGSGIVVNLQTGAATATGGFLHIGTLVGAGTPTDNLIGPNATSTWTLTGADAGTVGSLHFSAIANLTGGTGADTYKFTGASPSLAGTITDSGGSNKLDYSAYTGGPISVNLATMAASLINSGATSGFVGTLSSLAGSPNAGDTLTAPNTYNLWSITGANSGKLNSFTYTGIENLMGGSNVDVFKFSAAGTELSVNGGGAPASQGDWLDYSGFASAVAVNLVAGSATNVNGGLAGSVTNIQNVHGGNALNTLTGNSQGNILIGGSAGGGAITGGAGRSLLIADKGGASVIGGSGSDILIADSTTFDTMTTANELALMSILAEWQSADSYTDRFNDINKGTAYAGGSHLNGSKLLVWGTTVKDNGSPDAAATVTAAPSLSPLDWFFVDTNDTTVNYETGEHVNNT